ncbi:MULTISPECIES: hypothetical protein [unclassified Bacillus (in: firmicutes)]|uniref:hypothetical protein n=1 Tax=unclassified Bacillus (in: firmicutes) TaxID=185979 RepID=UPI0008E5B845|nr:MULTISPECIES: hypothetical protein [unclassified Bacillus (in: firmicutes)]SFA99846.1 hypothetical protein SAMN02799634_103476 [Bacillus sp. UNCCL13]SFQ81825.1 hypothetical protein SAMN04488577_2107 [Bacillus sp. cl95]
MEIPSELDGAKVIHITKNSLENRYGYVGIVDDSRNLIDKIYITAVAICQYDGSKECYLFSCDLNWDVIGDIDYDTIEEAKESAVNNHNVKEEDWIF